MEGELWIGGEFCSSSFCLGGFRDFTTVCDADDWYYSLSLVHPSPWLPVVVIVLNQLFFHSTCLTLLSESPELFFSHL